MSIAIAYQQSFDRALIPQAVELYDQAFGPKLRRVIRDMDKYV